jgi:hypothetical protein
MRPDDPRKKAAAASDLFVVCPFIAVDGKHALNAAMLLSGT